MSGAAIPAGWRRDDLICIIATHWPNGCWRQPDGTYAGGTDSGHSFEGDRRSDAIGQWANQLLDALTTAPPPPAGTGDVERSAIAAAVVKADQDFRYSFNLTRLVDGEETHTLVMPGFAPVEFADRAEGYALIAERRASLRADAVLAALRSQPAGEG